MRVVREFTQEDIRISVFNWNNKYLIKFESGPFEQTYKLSEMDVLDEEDLGLFYKEDFMSKVKTRFQEMAFDFKNQIEKM